MLFFFFLMGLCQSVINVFLFLQGFEGVLLGLSFVFSWFCEFPVIFAAKSYLLVFYLGKARYPK